MPGDDNKRKWYNSDLAWINRMLNDAICESQEVLHKDENAINYMKAFESLTNDILTIRRSIEATVRMRNEK